VKTENFLKHKKVVIVATLLAAASVILWLLDQISRIQTAASIVKLIPAIIKSWWFNPILYALGIGLIVWSIRNNRKQQQLASSAIKFLNTDECPVIRLSGGEFARGASDDKAIILWFENSTKFDYSNVRAWLKFSAFDDRGDEFKEYEGLWLGEYLRRVDFKAGERKALIVAIKQGSDFYTVINTYESDDWGSVPKLIPLNGRGYHVPTILSVDGAPSKVLKCQLTLEPKLDFRLFESHW